MIASASVSAFCHLSENSAKVEQAFLNVMPPELRKKFAKSEMYGHFNNKIVEFSKAFPRLPAQKFAAYLAANLSLSDKTTLVSEARQRLDGSTLFFRLDKQKALGGEIALAGSEDAISVSIAIATYPRNEQKILEEIGELFS